MRKKKRFTTIMLAMAVILGGCGNSDIQESNMDSAPKEIGILEENNIAFPTSEQLLMSLKLYNQSLEDIEVFNEDTDPNKLLGKSGEYISKADFSDSRIKQDSEYLCGGTIETFSSQKDCEDRVEYLSSLNSSFLGILGVNAYIYQYDLAILRVDKALTEEQAEEYNSQLGEIIENWKKTGILETENKETNKISNEETPSKYEIQETKNSDEQEESIGNEDTFLIDLKSVLDKDIAEKSYDILKNQIGFSELEYKGKMDGLTNYEIKADGYNIILTASDDVYRIFIPSSSYVFYEDEEVKFTFSDLESKTIDQYDRNVYYIMAQDIVCNGLKNPSSAKFPSIVTHPEDILMQRNGDIVAVQSYVDAKNDFNAKVRTNWIVEFRAIDMDTYSYEFIYINIGGEELGTFMELK